MKEITRIHIAKVAYDVEIDAKEDIQQYIGALERYANDPDILDDIEIRITELLAEAGVEKGGVITMDEVAKVRLTLGEPEEFAGDEPSDITVENDRSAKRLYRDMDSAMLGGVLSGTAAFFGIDVVWVRLIFIVLLFASFGTASLLYIVLWLVVPPARTAAEKLQMTGQPVTLESLRERIVTSDNVTTQQTARVLKSILFIGGGLMSMMVAIGAFIVTIAAIVSLVFFGEMSPFLAGSSEYVWMPWAAFGLFVASGLLLSALASLVSAALFKRQLTKRMGTAMLAIIVTGVLVFSAGAATVIGYNQIRASEAQAAMKTHNAALPSDFVDVRNIVITSQTSSDKSYSQYGEFAISYVATTDAPRYELRTQFDNEPEISVQGDTACITLKPANEPVYHFGYTQPQLTIYGPSLGDIDVRQGSFQYTAEGQAQQKNLRITTRDITSVTTYGKYENVSLRGGGSVDVSMSSVRNLSIDMEGGTSRVEAGVVYALTVEHPDACPAQSRGSDERPFASVRGVSSGKMMYNGTKGPLMDHTTPCGEITIGMENE